MYEQNNKEGEGTDWRIDFSNLKGKEFQYDEIPDLKDEHRPVEMNRSFIDALEKIAKKENDGSAQHRFLMKQSKSPSGAWETNGSKRRKAE